MYVSLNFVTYTGQVKTSTTTKTKQTNKDKSCKNIQIICERDHFLKLHIHIRLDVSDVKESVYLLFNGPFDVCLIRRKHVGILF